MRQKKIKTNGVEQKQLPLHILFEN
jgi:hypothetical protein